MDSKVAGGRALQSRWPLVLALVLALYSALLLAFADAGSRQRLADTNAWLVEDSQRRAQALSDVLSDLHAVALSHAELPEIRAYLANRDLGMSPMYGLNAARGAIDAALHLKAHDLAQRWGVWPPRIVYYSADGAILVDTAPEAGAPPAPVVPDHPLGLRVDAGRGTLEHAVAVRHKGQSEGLVVMLSSMDALHRKLLQAAPDNRSGHIELLLAPDGQLPPGRGTDLALQRPQLDALSGADENRVIDTAEQFAGAAPPPRLDDTLMIKTRVPQSPLLLVTFIPRALAYGHLAPRTLTIAGGLLLVLIVAGAFKLDRVRREAAKLTEEVAAAEQQRALTEFRNRELTAEITRREQVERALASSEQRWQLAVAGTNDGIWDWNIATGELFMSDRWLAMLGHEHGELPAHVDTWRGLVHADDLPRTLERLQEHLAGRSAFFEAEFRMRSRDGGYRWILGRGKAQVDADGRPVRMAGSQTDVTERRAADARLRDHTEQLNAIFELSPDGFVSFDADRRVRSVNRAFRAMTGLDDAAVLGLDEDAFSRCLAELGPPGHGFPGVGALHAGAGDDARRPAAGSRQLPGRHTFQLAGPPARVLEVGMQQADAANVSQVLYFRDVTRDTEVDRMKSEFLTTAAHELRTPMVSVFGFTELLLRRQVPEERRRDMLETIHRQASLLIHMVNELLDLARIEARQGKDIRRVPCRIGELVELAVAPLRAQPRGGDIDVWLPDGDTELLVDPDKMQQALTNVLSNAVKYSPGGGPIVVQTRRGLIDDRPALGVSVSDRGIGMTREQLARVFERFYRADPSGNIPGTGLGMSLVKEIVELQGGSVEVDSEAGRGTRVTLWLPCAMDVAPAEVAAPMQ